MGELELALAIVGGLCVAAGCLFLLLMLGFAAYDAVRTVRFLVRARRSIGYSGARLSVRILDDFHLFGRWFVDARHYVINKTTEERIYWNAAEQNLWDGKSPHGTVACPLEPAIDVPSGWNCKRCGAVEKYGVCGRAK